MFHITAGFKCFVLCLVKWYLHKILKFYSIFLVNLLRFNEKQENFGNLQQCFNTLASELHDIYCADKSLTANLMVFKIFM